MTGHKRLLIVAHGQPSDPAPPECHMEELAQRVAAGLPGWTVEGTTIAMPGALERKADALGSGSLVFPFFMSDGWFTKTVLPRRLGSRDVALLPPFGHDQGLPRLAARWLADEIAERGWSPRDTRVMLAAHGSARGQRAAAAAYRFAGTLARDLPLGAIVTGFVEQGPRLAIVAKGLGPRALCLPFFAVEGGHVKDDIPEALSAAGFTGATLPVLGDHPDVPRLIADAARAA